MQREPLDETELAIHAQQGDVWAYEELVRRYQDLAFRVAYVVTRDPEVADDAAQSGFVKAYYALHRYRAGRPFRPWLLKIVTNEARNQMRAQRRRQGREQQVASGDDTLPSPEDLTLDGLSRDCLLDAVNRLEPRDRDVITYRLFLGLSEAEMATVLGCRPGTVKSRLSRALGRLRSALDATDCGAGR